MGGFRQFRDVMMEMSDDAVLRNANGQIAALKAWKQKEEGAYTVYGSPELSDKQKALFENVIFENYKAGRKAYEKVYELPWEVETFEALLEEHVSDFEGGGYSPCGRRRQRGPGDSPLHGREDRREGKGSWSFYSGDRADLCV